MPPVTKAGGRQFRTHVAFAETKDSDEFALEATGIVMVPDKADLQSDFAREETIREFAGQFETFVDADEASGGVMHAVWPDEWMELERNEVLDEATDIGGTEVDAGAWVQTWGINDAELAALIEDGVLEGYSIGAVAVDWNGPFDPSEVEDVTVPDALPDGEMVWELTDGTVREVSAVDIPAVPDAEILEAKDTDKRLGDHIGNRDAFIDEALERGHSETEAERLWGVLNDAMEVDGAADPAKASPIARAGKAFLSALTPGSDGDTTTTSGGAAPTDKAGETLSQSNRESAMAAIDANLDMLEDAGVDHGMTRFTDRGDIDFNLSEHEARTFDDGDGEDGDTPFDVQDSKHAAGGDTPADNGGSQSADTETMGDDNSGEGLALAETNAEQISELNDTVSEMAKRVDTLTRALSGEEKTVEIELDGETHEVPKSQAEAVLAEDGGSDGGDDVADEVKELRERLDNLAKQSGGSDQVRDDGGETESGLEGVGKLLG